jgi:periplasmic divalent cation tolerance protein
MFGLSYASRVQLYIVSYPGVSLRYTPGLYDSTRSAGSQTNVCALSMIDGPSEPIVVLMTAPNDEEAGRIAETLVSSRLAACVQILPEIRSVYRWKGEITRENEVLLLAKTTRAKFTELEQAVRSIHSYETPEIVALQVVAISDAYLEWLRAEVAG